LGNLKVVSYRGTDQPQPDIVNGYNTAIGTVLDLQAQMAVDFYKSVIGSDDPRQANVVLTAITQLR
jgi:hypothetical protein